MPRMPKDGGRTAKEVKKTFTEYWESFEKKVIHPEASEGQRTEMMMAFVAGAVSYQSLMDDTVGAEPDVQKGYKLFENLRKDLDGMVKLMLTEKGSEPH